MKRILSETNALLSCPNIFLQELIESTLLGWERQNQHNWKHLVVNEG